MDTFSNSLRAKTARSKIQLPFKSSDPFQPCWGSETRGACLLSHPQPAQAPTDQIQVWLMSVVSAFTLHVCLRWNCWPNPTAVVICLCMCGRGGTEVREMKMTRPYLIVVSIRGLGQDVCLSVYLSICPSVLLLSWRHVSCQRVETFWLQSAIKRLIWSCRSSRFTEGISLDHDSIII